ncbi:MAG TPA: hypothetical protein VMB51_04090 [Solirubrobacteraceae bacterium]|nr:hypothetical protein [Solirubrobacteraceae bacterium]
MNVLRPWSAEPGTRSGGMQEFVAGAVAVSESRVLARPREGGGLDALALIMAVPPGSRELATLVAEHERGAIEGVDYFVRWASMLPSEDEPFALARLDMRFGAPAAFEARLLFDIGLHSSDLWAVVHSGWVQLASPDCFPHRPEIMTEAQDFSPCLMLQGDASTLGDTLNALVVRDPFIGAER